MLKLKLQYFGHLMRRVDSWEKTLMLGGVGAGGEGDDRGWDGWMASPTRWAWVWVNSGSWWWTGGPGVLRFMGSQRFRHDWVTTELNWHPAKLCQGKKTSIRGLIWTNPSRSWGLRHVMVYFMFQFYVSTWLSCDKAVWSNSSLHAAMKIFF